MKEVDKARAEALVVLGAVLLERQVCFSLVFAESEVAQEVFDLIFPGDLCHRQSVNDLYGLMVSFLDFRSVSEFKPIAV